MNRIKCFLNFHTYEIVIEKQDKGDYVRSHAVLRCKHCKKVFAPYEAIR